jgi:Ca2+-binding EF-hand superfamily protein
MHKQIRHLILLAVIATVTSCESSGLLQAPQLINGSASRTTVVTTAALAGVPLTGTVQAPADLVAVPIASAPFAPPLASRQLLAVGQAPLANTTVFLADAAGNQIPGIASVQTDANGKYAFANVPGDFTFMVAARAKTKDGKEATLQTLTKPGAFGATADVDAASTLVTAGVVNDQGAALGDFNPATFKTATEATAKQLQTGDLPDFSDRAAILARIAKFSLAVGELKGALEQMKSDMKTVKHDVEQLKKRLAEPTPPPGPAAINSGAASGCMGAFAKYDLNHDGAVTLDEFRQAASANASGIESNFKAHDRNGDGKITPDEACQDRPVAGAPPNQPPQPIAGPTQATTTAPPPNGASAPPTPRQTEQPRPQATAGQGDRPPSPTPNPTATPGPAISTATPQPVISAAVRFECTSFFKTRDLNGDGIITLEEFVNGAPARQPNSTEPLPATNFQKWDLNGDGKLTADEFCNAIVAKPTLATPTPAPTNH